MLGAILIILLCCSRCRCCLLEPTKVPTGRDELVGNCAWGELSDATTYRLGGPRFLG